MKILVVSGIFPPDIGGPATYVPQVAAGLTERGHQVTVLALADGVVGDPGDRHDFRVVRLSRRRFRPWRWLRTIATIIRLGREADVLFVNGLTLEAVLANFVLRKRMVQKVVGDLAWERAVNRGWVNDGFEAFQEKRYGFKVEILRRLRGWWTRRADEVIVPSRYLAKWVGRWDVSEAKIAVVPNGVDPPNGIAPADVPLHTSVNVVTAGRLVSWKRVDQVLEVIARVPRLGLVIIGDGPERRRLEALASDLRIDDRVHFAGARSQPGTMALMAACDVFVLNSTYEGFPHVIVEAMGLGLTVVATAAGGTPEIVRDRENGRLIPPSDSQALLESLSELMASPSERRRLSTAARRTADGFRTRRMLEESAAVLERSARAGSR